MNVTKNSHYSKKLRQTKAKRKIKKKRDKEKHKQKKNTEVVGAMVTFKGIHYGVAKVGDKNRGGKYICCLNYNSKGEPITKPDGSKWCAAPALSYSARPKHHYVHLCQNELAPHHYSLNYVPNVGCTCAGDGCPKQGKAFVNKSAWNRHQIQCENARGVVISNQNALPNWVSESSNAFT